MQRSERTEILSGSLARMLVRHRWVGFALAVLVLGAAWRPAMRIEMDRSLLALFSAEDPAAIAYRQSTSRMGDVPVVMLVYRAPELTRPEGIERNRELTRRVESIDGVRGVLSPSILNDIVSRLRPIGKPPALFDRSSKVARGFDNLFSGYTHAKDHTHAAVAAILEPDQVESAVESLRGVADQWNREHRQTHPEGIRLVGEPVLLDDAFDLIAHDGDRLAVLVVTLLGAVLLLTLRDLRVVVAAVLVIAWSVVVTRAVMVVASIAMSLVSSVLISIVAIIAATSTLHLGVAAAAARSRGASGPQAAERSLARLMAPIGWTCATTAAGFLALFVSRIVPVQQFGIMIAVATTSVGISLLLIGPAVLSWDGPSRRKRLSRPEQTRPDVPQDLRTTRSTGASRPRVKRLALRSAHAAIGRRWALIVASVLFTALASTWMVRAQIESNFLNNFRRESEIASAYREVEDHLGGSGVWDIVLPAPETLDRAFLENVRGLESRLRDIRVDGDVGLSKVLSLADADRVAQEAPLMGFVPPSTRLALMRTSIPTFYDALLSQPGNGGGRWMRIMLRSQEDLDADQKLALIDAVGDEVDRFEHDSVERPLVSGYYVLMTGLVRSLMDDQWRCLAISSLAIAMLLWFATGSVRDVAAALPANLAPIVWILGTAAVAQGRLNMGAAMIGACAIGLSIDGSVHYLIARRRATRRHSHRTAHAIAVSSAGKIGVPVLLATVALILGFGGLTTSQFVPTSTFGGLLSMTLAVATIANLTLLPAMVIAWRR